MKKFIHQLREHKFKSHLIIFLVVMFSYLGFYFAAEQGNKQFLLAFLVVVVFGNLLAMVV